MQWNMYLCDDWRMAARPMATLRFLFWLGLLIIEAILVITFYVVPQFQSHEYNPHPAIGLEIDTVLQEHPGLRLALIAYVGLFLFGNIGLVVMVWRAFKNVRMETRNN